MSKNWYHQPDHILRMLLIHLPVQNVLLLSQSWRNISRLNPATYMCLSQDKIQFPTSYVVVFFMLIDLKWEVIVRFIDMGGGFDQYRLKFLFMKINLANRNIRWGVLDTTLCDKVCQWLSADRWFSPGTLFSSTNKTDCHNITEILLKVALNTIKPTSKYKWSLTLKLTSIIYNLRYIYQLFKKSDRVNTIF